ncbi:UDP-N-acetylmuramate--L-alanine ligase [Candidatus Dependentiae bacterium]|nr:UDP-N-acetylmuramate--L-alanine ligase [Candidatus Dependentiae bacterium]
MYKKREHIHFMGIGGIGMSGIAEILRLQGYAVSGCDASIKTKTVEHLQSIGCSVYEGHHDHHVADADVLVFSSAINRNNLEVQAALAKGIPVITRALMLAELMRTKFSIAVSGAHGKTTTTSLISHILIESQRHPTVIIGGVLKNIANNAQFGDSDLLIAEADESDRSLLYLNPTMAVVTNIDAEHLDTYQDIEDIKNTFKNFLARLPFYGKAFVCIDDPHIQTILPLPHINAVKYGFSTKADVMGNIVELTRTQGVFDVYVTDSLTKHKNLLGRITLNIPGEHNVQNALAAVAVCLELDVPFAQIAQALGSIKGIERRFEFKGNFNQADIFDDYGHHPTEIRKTLAVAKRHKNKKLHVVFQPHRFSRTEKLWDDFVDLFARSDELYDIDEIFIADIYPASEKPIPHITSERLVEAIKLKNPLLRIYYVSSYEEIASQLQQSLAPGDLLLTVGAGKAYQIGEALAKL